MGEERLERAQKALMELPVEARTPERIVAAALDGLAPGLRLQGEAAVLQQQALAKCREADAAVWVEALESAADAAEQQRIEAVKWSEQAAELARVARGELRTAEDQCLDAHENAREAVDQLREAEDAGDVPSVLTELTMRVDASKRVADGFNARLAQVQAVHRSALETAEQARQTAEKAKAAANVAARNLGEARQRPENAPYGDVTIVLCWPQILRNGVALSNDEMALVRGEAGRYARQVGADKAIRAEGREAAMGEAKAYAQRMTAMVPAGKTTVVMPPQ